jgi:hypothetical protein
MTSNRSAPFALSAEIWVSPDGADDASGAPEAPFRTLQRAHEALCGIADRASGDSEVAIVLAGGIHRLSAPLVFDPLRFGPGGPRVRFRAAPGASPTISGGIRVEGWTLHDKALNIHKANVGANRSRQMYVDGRRATRTRTTLSDGSNPAGFLPSPILPSGTADIVPYIIGGGIEFIPTALNPERWRDPALWSNPSQIEAVIKTQWKMMSVPLREIVPPSASQNGMIVMQQPAWTNANVFVDSTTGQPAIWSFWQVTYFENAYQFLDQPGEWYLDDATGDIFYIPRPGENLATADVELAVLETLIEACGTPDRPVSNIHFEGITFCCATWLGPGDKDGYVADQSGFHLVGDQHRPNVVGHARHVTRTPGNLKFEFAHGIHFEKNRFQHLGAVALDFGTGCQRNRIAGNRFDDISSAAIQLGGVAEVDHHPQRPEEVTSDNVISNNTIARTGRDFVETAAIYIGFTHNTLVSHNTISEVPWSGIAIGWGWGLLDPGMFPGLAGATSGMWGDYTTPTPNSGNRIVRNHISRFLQDRWDGGAIYSTGQQGLSMDDPLLIEGNVACGKRAAAGGNIFYTDGGSRYVVLRNNASFDNPIGHVDLGPSPQIGDPLPYPAAPSFANLVPYGSDIGGCRTYGDIHYESNYWRAGLIPLEEAAIDLVFETYSKQGFFNICPYNSDGVDYPTGLRYSDNHDIPLGEIEVPQEILRNAGVRANDAPVPASSEQAAAGGASFPPANSGPSWNVPRVSLPGLFGMQTQYAQEWWYYVGTAYDTDGQAFSLQIQIGRQAIGAFQLGYGITGIGWRDGERSHYLSGIGFGLELVVPPVGDHAYSASFVPLLEIVHRSKNLLEDLHLNLPFPHGWDGWKFEYLSDGSAGKPVGEIGSSYAIAAHGRGYTTTDDSADTTKSEYRIALTVVDRRGTVMEGISGYVGPGMFADDDIGVSSYECAQPHLQIRSGGTLVIDGKTHTLEGGYVWLDRQMIAPPASPDPSPAPGGAEELKHYIAQSAPKAKQLYLGDWMSFVLNDGHTIVLAEFWQKSTPQWITGTGTGRPPKDGFGNLYFDVGGATPPMNGGIGLRPRKSLQDEEWDFDVNILEPTAPASSPHWQSPITGKTYATAWQIEFSPELTAAHELPQTLYVFEISDNCEIIISGNEGAFFEGAARVYADKERTRFLGHAFVEQMGFD